MMPIAGAVIVPNPPLIVPTSDRDREREELVRQAEECGLCSIALTTGTLSIHVTSIERSADL